MSEERLEEIKSRVWKDKGTYAMGDENQREGYIYTLSDYDYKWLIEQAEQVQELEKDIKEWEIANECWEEINENLAEQNKRYREQLELIRKDTFYEEHEFVSVRHLIRKRVDKALKGE